MNTGSISTASAIAPRHVSRRYTWGMLFYCAATSIPMSFCFFLLPALLREAGQGAQIIGMVSLVYVPYALRVVWAPLVDRATAGHASRCRTLALVCMFGAVVTLSGLLFVDPAQDVVAIFAVALATFVLLSTGMTALDAYTLTALFGQSRSAVSAWEAAGFTLGGIVLGCGALLTDGQSWQLRVAAMAGAMAFLALPLVMLPRHGTSIELGNDVGTSTGFWAFFKRAAVRRRVLLSLLTHGSLGMIGGYMPVLQVDSGLTAGQVGLYATVGSNIAGLAATGIAGWFCLRVGGWRCLQIISATAMLGFVVGGLAVARVNPMYALCMSLAVSALGYAFMVPYRAVVLTLCSGRLRATQAALLSSIDVVVSIIGASVSGFAVNHLGLRGMLMASALACLGSVLLISAFHATSPSDQTGN